MQTTRTKPTKIYNNIQTVEPADHKQTRLTKQQVEILKLIYLFRFVTTRQVQAKLERQQIQQAQQRLNLLLAKGYIGRNFSKQDRLTGKYASYYLLPAGMKVLKVYQESQGKPLAERTLHNLYKDKTASERFIKHQIEFGDIHLELRRLYGESYHLIPRSSLVLYDFLPESLPDGLVYLQDDAQQNGPRTNYFLEYLEDNVPFWVYRKRVDHYASYAYYNTWRKATGTKSPIILLICESLTLQRRTLRYLRRYMQDCYEDITFNVTNVEALKSCNHANEEIWREINNEHWEEIGSRKLV